MDMPLNRGDRERGRQGKGWGDLFEDQDERRGATAGRAGKKSRPKGRLLHGASLARRVLELGGARGTREGDDVAHVAHAGHIDHQTLEAQAET